LTEPAAQILAELHRLDRLHAAEQAELGDRQRRERGTLIARLLLVTAPKPAGLNEMLKPKQAQRAFGLSKTVLFRLGEKHPIGSHGGFCFIDEQGNRLYSRPLLESYLRDHPPRRQRRQQLQDASGPLPVPNSCFRSHSGPE
jgi:hypothetical protein